MLRMVMLLSTVAVMRCLPDHVLKAPFTSEGTITHEEHIEFHLRNTSLKKALASASAFFWLPLLGERGKTVNNYFPEVKSTKQGDGRGDFVDDSRQLCDLTGA